MPVRHWRPAAGSAFRAPIEPCHLGGGARPDRRDVVRSLGAAQHCERLACRGQLAGAAADHLAFALGRHFCVGALLAKAESTEFGAEAEDAGEAGAAAAGSAAMGGISTVSMRYTVALAVFTPPHTTEASLTFSSEP